MNPKAWNLKGYTGFVWGGCAFLVFVWAYFRLPETKDRTFHELDILFAKKVPARQFASTNVDAFDEQDNNQLAQRYSIAGQPPRRPSFMPAITDRIGNHGGDEANFAQRRASVTGSARRPSIAPAVTEYLEKH
jgi:hypothetical protein